MSLPWYTGIPKAFRLNFNLTDNPFIPDHEHQLEIIRQEREKLSETDPLYILSIWVG